MSENFNSKIILGTVQFGLDYGINNQSGKVSPQEIDAILSKAKFFGVNCLDTSYAYGDSEFSLGASLGRTKLSFNIISKYPPVDNSVISVFNESLKRLNRTKMYGYLVHNFDFYKSQPTIWEDFKVLKQEGIIEKIGFSIYNVDQLNFLLENNVKFDLIQFPYNLFDRQFESYFEILKNDGVEIHTRSVFLQGLFFMNPSKLTGNLTILSPYLISLQDYCQQKAISLQQIALNYVIRNSYIDGVLIGIDNVSQLDVNMESLNYNIQHEDIEFIKNISIVEKNMINPVNWKM